MVFEKVLSTINKHNLIESGDKIVIGISGGPDSVCLLHILSRLKDKLDIELYAAHLNHQIRGIEAQKDALYVSDICDKMGITYFLKSIDVPKYCEDNNLSIEEGARKLRYEMFDEIKQKTKSNKIAVGHNLNDQAETILMRIMRGTGLQGLRGIEYARENGVIRPLLDIERKDIEEYCEVHNLNPRIDESNLENIYTRNKIRLEFISSSWIGSTTLNTWFCDFFNWISNSEKSLFIIFSLIKDLSFLFSISVNLPSTTASKAVLPSILPCLFKWWVNRIAILYFSQILLNFGSNFCPTSW